MECKDNFAIIFGSKNNILIFVDGALLALLLSALVLHYGGALSAEASSAVLAALSLAATLPVAWSAARAVLNKKISVDLLASVALVFSLINGEWISAAFINLMLTSARLFAAYTDSRARRSIASLLKLKPKTAAVIRNGKKAIVAVEDLRKGDLVLVNLGERIPVDGSVVEGEASVDQSSLTGESLPVNKTVGETALSSAIIVSGNLIIRAEKVGEETTLEKIIDLVEKSQANKPRITSLADRFASWYILSAFAGAGAVYFFTGSLPLVLSVMLVVCADDLAIAIPLAFLTAVGYAAQRGVIIKGSNYLEGMAGDKVLLMDKTGTITKGKLRAEHIGRFNGFTEDTILLLAGVVSARSDHPTSQAIMRLAGERGINFGEPQEFKEYGGKGSTGIYRGDEIMIGRASFLKELGIEISEEQVGEIVRQEEAGFSVTLIAVGNKLAGYVCLADEIRPEIKTVNSELKNLGVRKTIMLTGDNEKIAARIARAAGVDEFYANLLPEDKLNYIKRFSGGGHKTIMVGDGINDAAALSLADIGVAMGGIGYDVAVESADIVLMKDDLTKLPEIVKLARYVLKIAHQNFWIWGIVNVVGLVLVFGGVLQPTGAAAYNFVTDFIPLANSARILKLYIK